MEIHAIQFWTGEVWRTAYLSTYPEDAADTYAAIQEYTTVTLRQVVFGVDNYDFIAAQARSFRVVDLLERTPESA